MARPVLSTAKVDGCAHCPKATSPFSALLLCSLLPPFFLSLPLFPPPWHRPLFTLENDASLCGRRTRMSPPGGAERSDWPGELSALLQWIICAVSFPSQQVSEVWRRSIKADRAHVKLLLCKSGPLVPASLALASVYHFYTATSRAISKVFARKMDVPICS